MAGLDLRPSLSAAAAAFGVPATVTRPAPDDTPIDTTVIWIPPLPSDMPIGFDIQRQEPKKVLAIALADVPTVPTNTLVESPERLGGEIARWRVTGFDRYEVDEVRVVVVPDES